MVKSVAMVISLLNLSVRSACEASKLVFLFRLAQNDMGVLFTVKEGGGVTGSHIGSLLLTGAKQKGNNLYNLFIYR